METKKLELELQQEKLRNQRQRKLRAQISPVRIPLLAACLALFGSLGTTSAPARDRAQAEDIEQREFEMAGSASRRRRRGADHTVQQD
jgi:hypothetical protein